MTIQNFKTISFFVVIFGIFGCTKDTSNIASNNQSSNSFDTTLPVLTTKIATAISTTSAKVGGNITNDRGRTIILRGVCYSTNQNPTTADIRIDSGQGGIGQYTCTFSNLSHSTTYYARAFAVTSQGVGYGNEISFVTLSQNTPDPATSIFIGGSDTLYHINAVNGNLIWKKRLDTTIKSISYTNGKVFSACNSSSASKIFCHDASGNLIWTKTLTELVISEILSYKEFLYYFTPNGLFAVNATTGAIMWQIAGSCNSRLVIYDDIVFIKSPSTCNGVALNYQTGSQTLFLGSGGFSTDGLIVHDSTVYAFNNFQNLISYNFSAGNYDYTNHSGFLFYGLGKIAYGLNSIYGCTADSYFRHGVAASTSSSGWFYYVSNGFYSSIRTPIIEDTLLILSRNYYASVYNAKNGYPISETANDEYTPIVGDVSIADKVIYQANEDALPSNQFFSKGKLSAFNALTGAVKWNSPERSNFGTMPCVVTVSGKMHRGRDIY